MSADTTPTNETAIRLPARAEAGHLINDRYKLVRCLASGGYGDVWSSYDEREGRRVAVKILRNDAGNNDPSALARMRQEAEILTALRHDNIVRVFSFEESTYGYFLVMELLEGLAIDQVLQREGPADPKTVMPVVGQLLSALHTAHAKEILHRDIKPENIILEGGIPYIPKLLDFGIAKAMRLLSDADSGVTLVQTRSGGFIGTPKYSPPEQAVGDPIGPSVDLYSLGLVLAEWLTGKPRITAERHGEVMSQLLSGSPHDVSDCPYPWQAWLKKMIAKSPSERFQTAREAMKAFEVYVVEGSKQPDFLDDTPYVASTGEFEFNERAFSDHDGPLELDYDRLSRSRQGSPADSEVPAAALAAAPPPALSPGSDGTGPRNRPLPKMAGGEASQPMHRPPIPAGGRDLSRSDDGDDAETLVMIGWLVTVFILSSGVVFFLMLFLGMI